MKGRLGFERTLKGLSSILDNLRSESDVRVNTQLSKQELEDLEKATRTICRGISHCFEGEIPIDKEIYELVFDLLNQAGSYVWDTKVGERIDARIAVIKGFYEASKL